MVALSFGIASSFHWGQSSREETGASEGCHWQSSTVRVLVVSNLEQILLQLPHTMKALQLLRVFFSSQHFLEFRYFQSCTAVTISERQPSAEAMTKLLWWTLTCSATLHGCPALSSVNVGCQWPRNLRMGENGWTKAQLMAVLAARPFCPDCWCCWCCYCCLCYCFCFFYCYRCCYFFSCYCSCFGFCSCGCCCSCFCSSLLFSLLLLLLLFLLFLFFVLVDPWTQFRRKKQF